MDVPVVDVGPLVGRAGDRDAVARALDAACREHGFFTVVGHGVDRALRDRLLALAREFFALPDAEKAAIAMARGGRAWRGWFPVGGELTSGVPDRKEGLYLGAELGPEHPKVGAGVPLHGPNLFPARPAALRPTVLEYLDAMTALGHALAEGLARALGLAPGWFAEHLTGDPLVLLRLFRYPGAPERAGWGVAEHTDYGLLTILLQDDTGGLEVRTRDGWTGVRPVPDGLVCNLGDMLERLTGGRYRSTPHRVRAPRVGDRLSCPFFFDPAWDAEVRPVPGSPPPPADATARWDRTSVHRDVGTYGEYLLGKVGRVFPALRDEVLPSAPGPGRARPAPPRTPRTG